MQMKAQNAALEEQNAQFAAQNAAIEAKFALLEEQIALLRSDPWSVGSGQLGGYPGSDFSPSQSATTASVPDEDDTVGQLQNWLDNLDAEFDNMKILVPQLGNTELSAADRMRLNGSGGKRYGFIEKTADIAEDFPQIWPGLVDEDSLNEQVREIEVLRNLLIQLRYMSRIVQDLLLIAGDRAFRLSGAYYAAARDGARRKNPEAQQVFQMLKPFWNQRRRVTAVSTQKQVRRDFNALENGTAEGSLYLENESDSVTGRFCSDSAGVTEGHKTVVDNVRPKQHRAGVPGQRHTAAKVEEYDELEWE